MKIEKQEYNNHYDKKSFFYGYENSETGYLRCHGLDNDLYFGISYYYHVNRKGFSLRKKKWL